MDGRPSAPTRARIPDDIQFATKPELALRLLQRAVDNGVSPGLVLADQAYGTSREFRKGVREMGLNYGVAVDNRTVVMVFDKLGRRRDEIIDAAPGVRARRRTYLLDSHSGASSLRMTAHTTSRSARRCGR